MPSRAYYEDLERHTAAHFAEDSDVDYNDFLEQQIESEDNVVSSFCTYRCTACDAHLTIGPMDTARLRKIKYNHDRDQCPHYDGPPLSAEGLVMYFDDAAWREKHVRCQVPLGPCASSVYLVGHAVPK